MFLEEKAYKGGKSIMTAIKQTLVQNADDFARHYDEEVLRHHNLRMKAPLVFVLLGEQVQEDIKTLKKAVAESMNNSEGVVYLGISTRRSEEINPEEIWIPIDETALNEKGTLKDRGELSQLLEQEAFLKVLNQKITALSQRISEKNKVFSYWEQMHISVITKASDPLNGILSDVSILLKNRLEQSFKQVFMDLFVLLDATEEDATPFQKALSYSLFQDLNDYESSNYHYERATELLEDEMKLMTVHNGRLFQLVYLLSDQKENGQRINEARKTHYETIVTVNLLKNRQQEAMELEEAREQYNYNTFITNIQEDAQQRYCTARLAKVKKPGQGIYLTVLYALFKCYKKELTYEIGQDRGNALIDQVGLSESKIEALVKRCMPSKEGLGEMRSLISRGGSFKAIKQDTFLDVEVSLYGESAKAFFKANFIEVAKRRITDALQESKLRENWIRNLVHHPEYGPFAISQLLKSEAYSTLEAQKEKYQYQMKRFEADVKEKENRIVGQCVGGNFGLLDKKYLQEVKDYLIEEVYIARYNYELESLKLIVLEGLQGALVSFEKSLQEQLKKLEQVESLLLEMIEEANRYEEEYLVQNVKEYYERLIGKQIENLKQTKGSHFLLEEKYMGSSLLTESEETIISRLGKIACQEILGEEKYFNLSFEEELLARANMMVDYEETEIVSKSELYEMLYESLEENSKPCVYLDTTLTSHRYIEKYFLGNRQSEFIEYAYKRDQSSRSYKIGTLHDQRHNVIEKLQIMGGFRLEDLVYTKSAKRYYDAYKEKGYVFHGEN